MKKQEKQGHVALADVDVEKKVLSACMLPNSHAIDDAADMLLPDDFSQGVSQLIFTAMLQLYSKGQPVDANTVINQMDSNGTLDVAGGRVAVIQLMDWEITDAYTKHYCRIIRDKAVLRRMAGAGEYIRMLATTPTEDVAAVVAEAESVIDTIASTRQAEYSSIGSLAAARRAEILGLVGEQNRVKGLSCGFADLDGYLRGLKPGKLLILGARPSMGKTTLALNIAQNVAIRQHKPVVVYSLEMSADELTDKIIYSQTRLSEDKLRKTDPQNVNRVAECLDRVQADVADAPLFVCDGAGYSTVAAIRASARQIKRKHGLDFIVIDYLQLMHGVGIRDGNRVAEISQITRELKLLSVELQIPILLLSQLSRALESRPNKVPVMSDLRDSGSTEQDADVVMFLYREDYYSDGEKEPTNIAKLIIAKNRNGATGIANLYFSAETSTFRTLAKDGANRI